MEDEVVMLEVDISQAEDGILKITEDMEGFGKVADRISTAIAKVFDPLAKNLGNIETKLNNMTVALTQAADALTNLAAALSAGLSAESTAGEVSLIGDVLTATLEGATGALTGLGIEKLAPMIKNMVISLGDVLKIGTGGAVALVIAVVAVVAAVIAAPR